MSRFSVAAIKLSALPLVWALTVPAALAQSSYTFTNIDFPAAGIQTTEPTGINDSGQIVGWYQVTTGSPVGFLLSGGVYTPVNYPGAAGTLPWGINANGQIVGFFVTVAGCGNCYGQTYPFLLSGGVYTALPEAPGSQPGTTHATAINIGGQIVGWYEDSCGCNSSHGFLLSNGVFTTVDDPAFPNGAATGINDSGEIVGYGVGSGSTRGFLLSGGVYSTIDDPLAGFTAPTGINRLGQVVGYLPDSGFLLSAGMYTAINVSNGQAGSTCICGPGINSVGQLVGTYADLAGIEHGFLATPGYLPTLSVSAKMDIYRAGGYNDNSDGAAPADYTLQPGTVQAINFSGITGLWTCSSVRHIIPPYGPDGKIGGLCGGGHINNPIGPFSGYDTTDFGGALAGVFLEDSLPTSPPPPLRFYISNSSAGGIQTNFTTLSPLIGQIFFIGDGLTGTGTGAAQAFQVPPTASHLYLGYVDSCNGTVPGCYADNTGSVVPIVLSPCGFSISPTSQSFGAGGGSGQAVVTTLLPPSSCPFSIISNASWITASQPVVCGPGGPSLCTKVPDVAYSVVPNAGPDQRVGTLTIAGQTLTVTQSGNGTCTYRIKPAGQTFGENGGKGTVIVTAQAVCSWSAVSGVSWVTISSGSSSGSGNGSVSFSVAANTGLPRTGALTIAGQTYTVTQSASGCGATDVSNLISVSQTALSGEPGDFDYYTRTISLTNRSTQTIPGPISLVMDGLPRTGFPCLENDVSNPTCNVSPAPPVTLCQSPNGSDFYQVSSGPMAPSQTITVAPAFYPGPHDGGSTSGFGYTTRVFSGTPTQ